MADARRRGHRLPVAARPDLRGRRRPAPHRSDRRPAGRPCRLLRAAARPGRPALQDPFPGPWLRQAARPPGRARLRRLWPPGTAPLAAGPGRLRPGLRAAADAPVGRGVRGGDGIRVRLAPGAGRHDPPRGPAAAHARAGRAVGPRAPPAPAAAALALRHRLRRGGRPASLAVRPGPAPAAQKFGLASGGGKGAREGSTAEKGTAKAAPAASPSREGERVVGRQRGLPRPPGARPKGLLPKERSHRGGPMRGISVTTAPSRDNGRCIIAA